jgi:hypothetical protein
MPVGVRCIYCGDPTRGVRKGEHVIPAALGTKPTIRWVCGSCNSQFSQLDKELCSHSPLSVVLQQELGTDSTTHWEYCSIHNIALEGGVRGDFSACALWPQLVVTDRGVLFYFDEEEARRYGVEDFARAFHNLVQHAIDRYERGEKSIIWERISRHPDRGTFPPRLFTRKPYDEWHRDMTFICRYHTPVNQRRIVSRLREWRPEVSRSKVRSTLGVQDPEGLLTFDIKMVLRALVKVGVNLLSYVSSPTAVNRGTFPQATMFARWGQDWMPEPRSNGFVTERALSSFAGEENTHRLQLRYSGGSWRFLAVFFGGRIGTCVHFPGAPIGENIRYDVIAPISVRDWTVIRHRVYLPDAAIRTEWDDISVIIPSMPSRYRGSRLRIKWREETK